MRKVLMVSAMVALVAAFAATPAWAQVYYDDSYYYDGGQTWQGTGQGWYGWQGDDQTWQGGGQTWQGDQTWQGTGQTWQGTGQGWQGYAQTSQGGAQAQLAQTGGLPLVPLVGGAAAVLLGGALLTRRLRQR